MLTTLKRVAAAGVAGGAIFLGVTGTGGASPVVTGGLVNVTITDVLSNNTVTIKIPVGVGLNVAANVCGVNVGVLAQDLQNAPVSCSNGNQSVTIAQVT
jgi:hypothetical protein